MNSPILEIKNLTKIYKTKKGKKGIFDLSFMVEKGSFHAFIGENGAGKTTTIKSIVSAYTNYNGEVLIDNKLNTKAESKKLIGYVPENTLFPRDITTYDYLKYLALLNGINKNNVDEKIDYMLEKFKATNLKHLKPYSFSSGQKKKVLLIQALIHDPELIILDEPAANLDPTARYELFNLLDKLHKEGKTIFISSHVLAEIDKYVDSFTLIHNGKIVNSGIKTKSLESIYYEEIISN